LKFPSDLCARAAALVAVAVAGAAFAAAQSSYALHRAVQSARAVEVHVEGPRLQAAVERLAGSQRASDGRELRIASTSASGAPDARTPRIVLGSASDPAARRLAEALGVVFQNRGFDFLGREYGGPADALLAAFEDPDRPGLPVTLYLGVTPEGVADYVHDLELRSSSSFATWRMGELEREGTLEWRDGAWRAELARDRQELRRTRIETDQRVELRGFRIEAPAGVDVERVRVYATQASAARAQVLEWAGSDAVRAAPALRLVTYDAPAAMRALLDRVDLFVERGAAGTVHVLLAPGLPDDGGAGVARATARALLGEPAQPWLLDAVGALHAPTYWGVEGWQWLAWLAESGLALPIAEIVDPEAAHRYSPHRLRPLRGMLLGKLLALRGTAAVQALWRGEAGAALSTDVALQAACDELLAQARLQHAETLAARRARERAGSSLRGFVVTGVGLSSARYAPNACADDVRRARELGANAFAFPFECWDRSAEPAAPGQPAESWPHGNATDLELAIELARAAGSSRWLAPQLLSSPNAGLAGEEVRTRAAEWEAFFDLATRVLEHYSLLTELLQAEGLFLGFELSQSTREPGVSRDPAGAAALRDLRYARWRELARALRRTTGAALSYGARFDGELEQFPAWDELDLVCELMFDPLPTTRGVAPDTTRDEISQALQVELSRLAEFARGQGKPALVLLGCAARERGWERRGARVGPVSQSAQQLWYEALARALDELGPQRRPAGLLLWALEPASDSGRFDPLGQPAESALPALLRASRP